MALEDVARRDAERRRHRENKGRMAGVYTYASSTGQGYVEYDELIDFGLTYIEQPFVSVGHVLDLDELRVLLGMDADDPFVELPQCTGFVSQWEQDVKGNYIGAYLAVQISWGSGIPFDAQVEIQHSFSFHGVAIKSIPDEVGTA